MISLEEWALIRRLVADGVPQSVSTARPPATETHRSRHPHVGLMAIKCLQAYPRVKRKEVPMTPVGGSPARRLRGAKGLVLLSVTCSCGETYEVSETAIDLSRCPNRKRRKPTRDVLRAR